MVGLGLGLVVGLHLDLDVGDGAREGQHGAREAQRRARGQPSARHRGRRRAGDLQMQGDAEERQAVMLSHAPPT